MSEPETDEKTVGGFAGRLTGKAKELAGELTNNDELAREGRLQQAQGDAQAEAAEARRDAELAEAGAKLEAEQAATARERDRLAAERQQVQAEQAAESAREHAEAVARDEATDEIKTAYATSAGEKAAAADNVGRAEAKERELTDEALKLEHAARQAEAKANALDPKE